MLFRWSLSPSTMTPPPFDFHALAISSKTFSARPSSRHPDPQCLPIKAASNCSADDVRVRLCFFVKVRKANGRNVAGGRLMERTEGAVRLEGGGGGGIGLAGVAKAGDEEGIGSDGTGFGVDSNKDVVRLGTAEALSLILASSK